MSTWTVPVDAENQAVVGYTQLRELGYGSSGRVVEAVDDASGRRVAIKLLAPDLVQDPEFVRGLRAEAGKLRELSVPQVAAVYDFVERDHGAAVVMELVDGVSLHDMIARYGPLGPRAALTVLKDALLGLAAAHPLGLVHRDLKPENVLIDTDGNSRLTDFGIAVRWGKQAPAAGTPLYLAPERWLGEPAGPAADFYAAAAACFECLTGTTPFSGGLPELREQHLKAPVPVDRIDPPLQGLIARGLAKNPADRPQSAIAFVSELEAVALAACGSGWEELGREVVAARAAELLPLLASGRARGTGTGSSSRSYARPRPGRNRKRGLLATAAVAAVLVIGGIAAAVAFPGRSHHSASLAGSSPPGRPASAQPRTSPPVTSRPMTPTPMRAVPAPAASAGMPTLMGVSQASPGALQAPVRMTFVSDFSGTVTLGTPVDLGGFVHGARGPLTWTVTGLAPGLTVTPGNHRATLVITGTPTKAGIFPFTVSVTDSGPAPSRLTGTFWLTVSPQPWSISTTALPAGTAGAAYTATLASSSSATVTWSATGLPAGLSIDPATGTISGTPKAAASATVYVTATVTPAGAGITTKTATYGLTVNAAPSPSAPSPPPSATE
jgi:serine/threonine protein kinase